MNSFKDHYFIEEHTPYTTDYITHRYVQHEDINAINYCKRFKSGKWTKTSEQRRFITSGKLIKTLFDAGYFKEMTYNNSYVLSSTLYKDAKFNIEDLHYDEKYCTRLIKPPPKKKNQKHTTGAVTDATYFYADFEADVSANPHKCYMCCIQRDDGSSCEVFKGEDLEVQFLDYLSQFDKPVVYFHNLKYDFSFIAKHGIKKSLQKGSRLMRAVIEYKGKPIHTSITGHTDSVNVQENYE